MEDAAARIEASMGSLAAGEVMASPAMAMREVDIEAVRKDCKDRSDRDLKATLDALRRPAPSDAHGRGRHPAARSTRSPPRSRPSTAGRRSS